MKKDKIKLVVVNENILGYVNPEDQNTLGILHASILRGANIGLNQASRPLLKTDHMRLANKRDFEIYRVHFDGYDNVLEYEFEII